MSTSSEIIYRLNPADILCFANKEYDEFASANDGQLASSIAVLQRSLWDFITEPTTQQLYREIVRCVRMGASARFDFRCDSPGCRRTLEMNVAREENGGVEFRTRTLSEELRPSQILLESRPAISDELLRVCSWCNAVNVRHAWVEVEEAVKLLRLFERSRMPHLTHGICGPCRETMIKTVSKLRIAA